MEENTVKPGLFEKGGKLGWLHSTVDAFDTFLRVPATVTAKGSHVRDAIDIKRVMIIVVLALVPAALFGMWNVGYQHDLAVGDLPGFWRQFWWGFLKVLPLHIRKGSVRRNGNELPEPSPPRTCVPVLLIS